MFRRLFTAVVLLGTASCGSSEITIECAQTDTLRLVKADLGPNGTIFATRACACEDYLAASLADCELAAEGKHCIPDTSTPEEKEKEFEKRLADPVIATGSDEAFCRAVGTGT